MAVGDSPKDFVANNFGWSINFIFAHVLFWAVAFGKYDSFGYTDELSGIDENGGYPSGPAGSGVFPISLTLMIVGTITYFNLAVRH